MKKKITVREVTEGYFNDAEEGVVGYDEQLDIRPKYQREFVYKDEQRNEVIRTVMKGLSLNVMYWSKTGNDTYEVLDGQPRTISVTQYVNKDFPIKVNGNDKYHNKQYNSNTLEADVQKLLMDNDVTKNSGIISYVLSDRTKHDEKSLSTRVFEEYINKYNKTGKILKKRRPLFH